MPNLIKIYQHTMELSPHINFPYGGQQDCCMSCGQSR